MNDLEQFVAVLREAAVQAGYDWAVDHDQVLIEFNAQHPNHWIGGVTCPNGEQLSMEVVITNLGMDPDQPQAPGPGH